MNTELGRSGNCSYSNNMVLYLRFNENGGSRITDWSEVFGIGEKMYPDMANFGVFLPWNIGWTTDTPGMTTTD